MAIDTTSRSLLVALGLTFVSALASAQSRPTKPAPAPETTALEVARVGFVEGTAEVQKPGGAWVKAVENMPLAIGDHVRTGSGGTVRLEFPWTAVAVGDGTEVSIDKSRVLTLHLMSGRIDVDPEQSLMRVVTAEAAVTGSGRTLLRREGDVTFVGSYNGGADVEGASTKVRLGVNRGTVVNKGAAPSEPFTLPRAPRVVSPSADPRYARVSEAVHLTWAGEQQTYHLEVLPIDSDVPVLALRVDATEFDVRLPWLGTYRWRVAGRSGAVETQPSGEGLICIVDK